MSLTGAEAGAQGRSAVALPGLAELYALRLAAFAPGPRWLRRERDQAERLGRAGFSGDELESESGGDRRWPGRERPTRATVSASRAIDDAFAKGARAACAAAAERWFDDCGYGAGDVVYHAAGLCIDGARAADVDADTLRAIIIEVATARGVDVESRAHLEYECEEACRIDWVRPTFQPPSTPQPNPVASRAATIFEGWAAQ